VNSRRSVLNGSAWIAYREEKENRLSAAEKAERKGYAMKKQNKPGITYPCGHYRTKKLQKTCATCYKMRKYHERRAQGMKSCDAAQRLRFKHLHCQRERYQRMVRRGYTNAEIHCPNDPLGYLERHRISLKKHREKWGRPESNFRDRIMQNL